MGKYLRISSYIRKPFLIYAFATAPLWISINMRKNFFFIRVPYIWYFNNLYDINWEKLLNSYHKLKDVILERARIFDHTKEKESCIHSSLVYHSTNHTCPSTFLQLSYLGSTPCWTISRGPTASALSKRAKTSFYLTRCIHLVADS